MNSNSSKYWKLIASWKSYLCLIAIWILAGAQAQDLSLAAEAANAAQEARDAFGTLMTLKKAAEDAMAGKPVSFGTEWSTLADKYDKAAAQARSARLPSQLVLSDPVKPAELTDCDTRTAAVAKLNKYLIQLQNAQTSGQASLIALDAQLADVAAAREALRVLKRAYREAPNLPVIGDFLIQQWFELDTRVTSSLSALGTAFKDQKKRCSDDLMTLKQRTQNLQANLRMVHPCHPLRWNWAGTPQAGSVQFGTPGYCRYNVRMGELSLKISIDADGHIRGGQLLGTMHETLVGSCSAPAAGDLSQTYLAPSGSVDGNSISATFSMPERNPRDTHRCSAKFVGTVVNGRLNGDLTIHRFGENEGLNWTTTHKVQ